GFVFVSNSPLTSHLSPLPPDPVSFTKSSFDLGTAVRINWPVTAPAGCRAWSFTIPPVTHDDPSTDLPPRPEGGRVALVQHRAGRPRDGRGRRVLRLRQVPEPDPAAARRTPGPAGLLPRCRTGAEDGPRVPGRQRRPRRRPADRSHEVRQGRRT